MTLWGFVQTVFVKITQAPGALYTAGVNTCVRTRDLGARAIGSTIHGVVRAKNAIARLVTHLLEGLHRLANWFGRLAVAGTSRALSGAVAGGKGLLKGGKWVMKFVGGLPEKVAGAFRAVCEMLQWIVKSIATALYLALTTSARGLMWGGRMSLKGLMWGGRGLLTLGGKGAGVVRKAGTLSLKLASIGGTAGGVTWRFAGRVLMNRFAMTAVVVGAMVITHYMG